MIKKEIISQSKDVLGGTPVFNGTRVPVKTLIDYLEAGRDLKEFLDDFPPVEKSQTFGLLELCKKTILGSALFIQ